MSPTQLQQTFVGTHISTACTCMYVRGTACSPYIAHIIGVAKVYCTCSYLLSPHHLQTKLNVGNASRQSSGSWELVVGLRDSTYYCVDSGARL